MEKYDPLEPPVAEEWLVLDEEDRLILVKNYHRAARIRLPKLDLHATLHVIVENQAALGAEIPVHKTIERLMNEEI